MFEIWTFPNIFLFFATLWGRKSSIPHNHTFNFFFGKVQILKSGRATTDSFSFLGGTSSIPEVWTLAFFWGKS
jgi:hypothetical protein